MSEIENEEVQFSRVLITLFKGVLYRDQDEGLWNLLTRHQSRLRDHLGPLQLELALDEAEGYGWLKNRAAEEGEDLPRLVPRHRLSYNQTLLLVLLRKKLLEHDTRGGELRLVMTRVEINEMMKLFLPQGTNEARQVDIIGTQIRKAAEMGFLRKMESKDEAWEIRRILKAFVDAQWLSDFDNHLQEYLKAGESEDE